MRKLHCNWLWRQYERACLVTVSCKLEISKLKFAVFFLWFSETKRRECGPRERQSGKEKDWPEKGLWLRYRSYVYNGSGTYCYVGRPEGGRLKGPITNTAPFLTRTQSTLFGSRAEDKTKETFSKEENKSDLPVVAHLFSFPSPLALPPSIGVWETTGDESAAYLQLFYFLVYPLILGCTRQEDLSLQLSGIFCFFQIFFKTH